jgi:CheY-like chemotaxis protein
MLGLASYQDALRALGRRFEAAAEVQIVERADLACVEITTSQGSHRLGPPDLEEVVIASHAHRGEQRAAGPVSDLLRSVGLALDDLHARDISLELKPDALTVRFSDGRELTYAGEELDALRRSAAARRNGQPLKRVLILQADVNSALHLRELLVAEFAVQALPTPLARAVVAAAEAPDLVLAQTSSATVEALQMLRAGAHTAAVPILVVAGRDHVLDQTEYFGAGADDLLQEPIQPALLRARVRTWLLRGRTESDPYYSGSSHGLAIDQSHDGRRPRQL